MLRLLKMCGSSIKFSKRFLQASENGISYDCKFIVGSQNIVVEGHKFLFAVASEVFQAMFYGELKEDNSVKIEDLDANGFESMKHFIYTGEVDFKSAIHALSTYIAARKYLIPELTKKCMEHLIQDYIDPSEILEFHEYCQTNNIPEFDELCFRIIEENTEKVVNSEYFPTAKIETIELILKSRCLKLKSEIEVFNIFERWALAEAARKQISEGELATSFKNLKKCIRFLTISKKEFTSRIEQSLLLTQGEKRAIECNLLQSESKPMPENLSLIQHPRSFLSTLSTSEKYDHNRTFVIRLDDGYNCASCSQIDVRCCNILFYLRLTVANNKYLCFTVQPVNEFPYHTRIFNMQAKIQVLAVHGYGNDLTFRKECNILQKEHFTKESSAEVLVVEIPLNKLNYLFFLRGTKAVTVRVLFNIAKIDG